MNYYLCPLDTDQLNKCIVDKLRLRLSQTVIEKGRKKIPVKSVLFGNSGPKNYIFIQTVDF